MPSYSLLNQRISSFTFSFARSTALVFLQMMEASAEANGKLGSGLTNMGNFK